MKEVSVQTIADTVARLAVQACCHLPEDVVAAMKEAAVLEPSSVGRTVLAQLVDNAAIAAREDIPVCQDTGLTVVFGEGYLRKSCVAEPLFERRNTGTNTPAIVHVRLVPGDRLSLLLAPKGAGSENKSIVRMLVPADGMEGVRRTVLEAVEKAGPNSCPPMVVGVGLGGTMEVAALLAKRAAVRPLKSRNADPRYAALEDELLELVNRTGIGPQGLGGVTTAFAVHVEWAPTHIAMLPVAVNINCNAARHASAVL